MPDETKRVKKDYELLRNEDRLALQRIGLFQTKATALWEEMRKLAAYEKQIATFTKPDVVSSTLFQGMPDFNQLKGILTNLENTLRKDTRGLLVTLNEIDKILQLELKAMNDASIARSQAMGRAGGPVGFRRRRRLFGLK
ncbi:MAG: hypothetical protein ABIJ08_06140 [Nanoarchaeota archaeon]